MPPAFETTNAEKIQRIGEGGLNTTLDILHKLCAGDTQAQDALNEAQQQPVGTNQHTEGVDNVSTLPIRPSGNSRDRALRKLRTEAEKSPEVQKVYQKVLAEEISPHRGMILCGFRKVPTKLEQVQRLIRALTDEEFAELIAWRQSQGSTS